MPANGTTFDLAGAPVAPMGPVPATLPTTNIDYTNDLLFDIPVSTQ